MFLLRLVGLALFGLRPVTLKCNSTLSPALRVNLKLSFSFDEADGFVVPEHLPPLTSLTLQSSDVLELTVTKTFLSVLNTLTQSFTEIGELSKEDKKATAPLVVKNSLGKQITIILDNRGFKYFVQVTRKNKSHWFVLLTSRNLNT